MGIHLYSLLAVLPMPDIKGTVYEKILSEA